jgi:isoquinoline 1-oxidoreductase alpha subunit
MPKQTFILNGKPVTVNVHDDVRVLWVLRDLLGVTGPKYGCGINVCKACTSHLNGRAFNPCSVRVGDLRKTDRVTTIEGLPREHADGRQGEHDRSGRKHALHPMQQAWLDHDVAQCGYCQPGQIMAAVALVHKVRREGRKIKEKDLDAIRNICRCGSYTRIREAIEQGARHM